MQIKDGKLDTVPTHVKEIYCGKDRGDTTPSSINYSNFYQSSNMIYKRVRESGGKIH